MKFSSEMIKIKLFLAIGGCRLSSGWRRNDKIGNFQSRPKISANWRSPSGLSERLVLRFRVQIFETEDRKSRDGPRFLPFFHFKPFLKHFQNEKRANFRQKFGRFSRRKW